MPGFACELTKAMPHVPLGLAMLRGPGELLRPLSGFVPPGSFWQGGPWPTGVGVCADSKVQRHRWL